MASKYNFTFELSDTSINKLCNELTKLGKDINSARAYILKALGEYMYERVQIHIAESVNLSISTGALAESIKISEISNDMVRVYTDLAYAKFVEYGTGIVGSHPEPADGWTYDANGHGESGWVYQTSDGITYWTQGEEAHEFMYKAYLDLKENYMNIAMQALKERGLI